MIYSSVISRDRTGYSWIGLPVIALRTRTCYGCGAPCSIGRMRCNGSHTGVARAVMPLVIMVLISIAPSFAVAQTENQCGLMVMAHGGSEEWNHAVEAAVDPLRDAMPTRIAFGMADPATMSMAVAELEQEGVDCIAVVRLFVSAKSFLHQTEYLLGLRSDAPAFFISHGGHGSHHGANPEPLAVKTRMLISDEGLLDAPEVGSVLAERVRALQNHEVEQSVLILAHGVGDDNTDAEWLGKMDLLADSVRGAGNFRAVRVATLREDWKDKRVAAETRIREFVEGQSAMGVQVIVVPFRLFGFGPYAKVLEGLTYEADGTGLLPSPAVTSWIESQARELSARITNTVEGPSQTDSDG